MWSHNNAATALRCSALRRAIVSDVPGGNSMITTAPLQVGILDEASPAADRASSNLRPSTTLLDRASHCRSGRGTARRASSHAIGPSQLRSVPVIPARQRKEVAECQVLTSQVAASIMRLSCSPLPRRLGLGGLDGGDTGDPGGGTGRTVEVCGWSGSGRSPGFCRELQDDRLDGSGMCTSMRASSRPNSCRRSTGRPAGRAEGVGVRCPRGVAGCS